MSELFTATPDVLDLTVLSQRFEHYETPRWAVDGILRHELLSEAVIDPCCGTGVLSEAAKAAGYCDVRSFDIHDWGYAGTQVQDFLAMTGLWPTATVLMNPPFSKAVGFVEKAFELGVRKIVMFQRFAFWESGVRRAFWAKYPPNRVYICGDRATCYRHDLSEDARKNIGSTPTAHAWFVFERGHPTGTVMGHIYKGGA